MAIRDDITYSVMSEVQRFRSDLLTEEEKAQIKKDVTAFCIIEIRKYCGEDIFNIKAKELEDKGISKLRPQIAKTLVMPSGDNNNGKA